MRRLRNGFAVENVAMHPHDQHLLIVGTIEACLSAFYPHLLYVGVLPWRKYPLVTHA